MPAQVPRTGIPVPMRSLTLDSNPFHSARPLIAVLSPPGITRASILAKSSGVLVGITFPEFAPLLNRPVMTSMCSSTSP